MGVRVRVGANPNPNPNPSPRPNLHVGLLPVAAARSGDVAVADGLLDLVPEREDRAGEQVLVLDAPAVVRGVVVRGDRCSGER